MIGGRRTGFDRVDAACALGIVAVGLLLWVPAIDVVALNPDESQYEATASYLVATDTSAFLPNGAPGIFGFWKAMTWLAGPYPIHAMRVLLTGLAILVALALYVLVRDDTGPAAALLASVLFLCYVQAHEGLVVNREWPAVTCTVLGVLVYLRAERDGTTRPLALFAAGVLCGMALWFKLQVSFMTLIVPVTMLARAATAGRLRRLVAVVPPFAAGGVGAVAVYLLPFWLRGELGRFLELVVFDTSVFVGGNEAATTAAADGLRAYVGAFLVGRYAPSVFLVAYLAAAAVLACLALRLVRRGGPVVDRLTRPAPLVFTFYLLLGMVSVRLGHRFFAHYFQLMLPAVAALQGLAVAFLWRTARDRRGWQWASLAVAALLLAGHAATLGSDPTWTTPRVAGAAAAVVAGAGLLGIVAFWARRPLAHATTGLALLIALEAGVVTVRALLTPTPASMSHSPYRYDELVRVLRERAGPDDMLFVWGWAPEIYSLSRITAASHITSSQYVANDLKGVPNRPVLSREWAELLMSELRETRPRFIVDASARSWYETEPGIYRLRNFPEFELRHVLRREYRRVGMYDGCDLWVRADAL